MSSEIAQHEITKEAVALMRRAASITGNEEIKFAASHIQSEYDKKHATHPTAIAKELPPKVEEFQTQRGTALRANMEQRKKLFSSERGLRQIRQSEQKIPLGPQGEGFQQRSSSLRLNRQTSWNSSFQPKGNDQQLPVRTHQESSFRRNRKIDAQGKQFEKEIVEEDASSSSGTLSDVSSNGFSEKNAGISMVHFPPEQKEQRATRPQVHPLQRTKSASTSDLRGRNQRKPQVNNRQNEDETSFSKLTLEEAHTLQSIADKTGNRQLKAISSRVQKIVNEQAAQTPAVVNKEVKETQEVKETKTEQKTESAGYLSLIDLIPIEPPQSSICELCDTCSRDSQNISTSNQIEAKVPPPVIAQEPLSGASAC